MRRLIVLLFSNIIFLTTGFAQIQLTSGKDKLLNQSNINFQNSSDTQKKEGLLPKSGGWTPLGLDKVLSLIKSGSNIIAGTYLGGVYLLKNNETSWNQLNNGLSEKQVNTLTISENNIFAGTYGSVFLSTNLCSNWSKISSGLDGGGPNILSVIGNRLFFASGYAVYYSTDNCSSWTKCLPDVNAWALASKGTGYYIGTYGKGIYKSTDDCQTWIKVNTGLNDTHVLSLICSGDNLLAGTEEGNIFLSSNDGDSWTEVYKGTLRHIVQCFAVNGSIIVAGIYGNAGSASGSEGVLVSIDNGYHWSQINDGLSEGSLYINTLLAKGDSILVGTAVGVYMRLQSEINVLTTSTKSLSIEASASNTNTFNIISNTSWTVVSDQTWLTVSSASGSGNSTITLTAIANPTTSPRTASVTVSGSGVTAQTVTVIQSGNTTGVEELGNNQNIKIYPNPSRGRFTLGLNDFNCENTTIRITNSIGIVVREMRLAKISNNYNQEIDLSSMASGIYFITVQTDKTKEVKSVVISNR